MAQRIPQVIVLDTSVVVKWFFPEEGSDLATIFLDLLNKQQIYIFAPLSLAYEFANVLWVKRHEGITEEKAQQILTLFRNLDIPLLLPESYLPKAVSFSYRFAISVYDAVFVALADDLNCDLITADESLFKAMRRSMPRVKILSTLRD